jgi:Tol biopolymer transport system component
MKSWRAALARALCALLLASAGGAAQAAREPVLRALKLPHNYYWRELYLPQLTSGPSAATWSPDGKELVYGMAGSLWRQRIGSNEAVELTHGPGYDYQPDWSRDGRWVVFVRHDHDALALHVLDLEQGAEHALTRPDAVDVEPRFSPDGQHLAFVSTRDSGQFNVHVARFDGAALLGAAALLPIRISAVRRYYYGPTDHVIHPSWTPDGSALLVVTNREIAWGTGDIWRIPIAQPDRGRMLVREETSWAARPELAPGGRRLLYSSYQGRQWHQLWIASAEGESPMPLSFGDFDRRQARWSPDGRRVLYVSNETGNTSLWVQDVVGGARQQVVAKQRRAQRSTGTLTLAIRGPAGEVLAARVNVLSADGRHYGPDDAWLHADDGYDRARQAHEDHYFHCDGDCSLRVPQGEVRVRVQRGLELLPLERSLRVAGSGARMEAVLEPKRLPPAYGEWTSADLHVHMNYGGHYRNLPASLARQARAEDLDVVYNLVVNKEQRIDGIEDFTTRPWTGGGVRIFQAQEFHTSYWGHLGLLHLDDHFLTPDFAAYRHTGFASPWPHNGVIAELAHAQGALLGYVHPYDWPIVPESEASLSHQFPADAAHGRVDYFELVSFSDPRANDSVWHRLLNLGYRIPAGAGTDAMANYASLRGPVGLNRTYLAGTAPDATALTGALRHGRGFVTNAPLLGLRIDGASPGDTLAYAAPRTVRYEAAVRSIVPLDRIEILVNGKVARRLRAPNRRDGDFSGRIELPASGWVALRAMAMDANPLVADLYPYGHTNPVWVEIGAQPARSPLDAAYFVRWMERVIADAAERDEYHDDIERTATIEYLEAARAIFERQEREP